MTEIILFEKTKTVYPKAVRGRYRQLKWLAMAVLLTLYFVTPWLRWGRGPGMPDQAILIDLPSRRAFFFGIEIWPQEIYFLAGMLILGAIGLFFATSLLGRVWCGYACPQTVWTDLFVTVERWFQGDRNAQMRLDQASWNFNKIWRKAATHVVWIAIGATTALGWIFYFTDAPTLLRQLAQGVISPMVAGWLGGLTLATYIMGGRAREQVCFYMCPYARFQSAMFDRDTLIISYEAARGEPRAAHKQGDSWEGRGHCVDCNLCVAVCPTGIDIRDGLQMGCIACGLCVDACNHVMDKVGLPQGLIRYDTERNQESRAAAAAAGRSWKDKLRFVRPRSFWYLGLMSLVGGAMLYVLLTRAPTHLHAQHERNPLLVRLTDGGVRNNYTLNILNETMAERHFALTVEGLPQAGISLDGAGNPVADDLVVAKDSVAKFHVMVRVPSGAVTAARLDMRFVITDKETGDVVATPSWFVTRE